MKQILTRFILLVCCTMIGQQLWAQTAVSGRVTDADTGEPLAGATISVVGAVGSVTTNDDGNFTAQTPSLSSRLQVSYVGYQTAIIDINGRAYLSIALTHEDEALEEVVVVGYGTVKKSDLTGAIQRIDASKFDTQPTTNAIEMLSGTVAGFNSNQGTTASGGGTMEIRGQKSLAANNNPLIVLDGVIYNRNISDINPNDIESIDVLKDASSAAVFGSRSAAGVIIITTKRGKTGKPTIGISSNTGVVGLTKHMKPLEPDDYLQARAVMFTQRHTNRPSDYYTHPDKLPVGLSVEEWMNYDNTPTDDPEGMWLSRLVLSPKEQENYRAGRIMDWYDAIFRNGVRQDYDVNVSGGAENVRYYLSSGYTHNQGYSLGDEFKTFRSRVNVDADLASFLKVGVNAQFSNRDQGFQRITLDQAVAQSPFTQIYDDDGVTMLMYPNDDALVTNPFVYYTYRDLYNKTQMLYATLFGELRLPYGFSLRVNYLNNYSWAKDYMFDPINTPNGMNNNGYGERSSSSGYEWTIDNILKWNKSYGNVHNFDFTFLFNVEKYQTWLDYLQNAQFEPNDLLSYHALQSGLNPSLSNTDNYSTGNALMARLNYSLLDKYLLTLTWRRDGYSAFGQANPYAHFPSAALAWRISEEQFFDINWLSNLKIRASMGVNGNRASSPYAALARLTANKYVYGNELATGVYAANMANSGLKWERTQALNFGLDFGLLDNRINGSLDYYDMVTSDLLLTRTLPRISGYSSVAANLGELGNKGFEFTANSVNINKTNFRWESTLNFSFNRNKIEQLYGEMIDVLDDNGNVIGQREADDITNSWFIGQSIDRVWDYETLGVWQIDEAEQAMQFGKRPGDIKLRDVNGDGVLVPLDDKIFQGYSKPQYRLGFRNDITFLKNFQFSAFIRADLGFYRTNNLYKNDGTGGQWERRNTYATPYWTEENGNNEWARLISNVSSPSFNIWRNSSFLRLQDVSLSYSFESKAIERFKLQNLRIYASLRNYLTITSWEHFDPESGTSPMPKIVTFGLNVGL